MCWAALDPQCPPQHRENRLEGDEEPVPFPFAAQEWARRSCMVPPVDDPQAQGSQWNAVQACPDIEMASRMGGSRRAPPVETLAL